MNGRATLIAGRLALALLVLAAVGAQLAIHVAAGYSVVSFFSYFTNLSNLFAAAVLTVGATRLARGRAPTRTSDSMRGAAVVNMLVVGLVFSLLLRNVDLGALRPWVNGVLHYVMPVAVALEWVLAPPTARLGRGDAIRWLAFPTAYLAYSLARGALTGWYPYPFLNPATIGGYGHVAAYAVGIFGLFAVLALLVLAVGNARRRPAAPA